MTGLGREHWEFQPTPRRVAGVQVLPFNEPPAGRSALDMRRAGVELPGEGDVDHGGWLRRSSVTLPKLVFLEGKRS